MSDAIPADKFIVSRPMQEFVTALAAMQRTAKLVVAARPEDSMVIDTHKLEAEPALNGFSIAAKDMQDLLVGPDIFYRAIPVNGSLVFPDSYLEFTGRNAESVRQIFRNLFTGYIRFAIETTELKNYFDVNCYSKEITPHRDYKVEALVNGESHGVRLLDGEELVVEIKTGLSTSVVNALICGMESSIDTNLLNVQGVTPDWEFLKEE